MVNKNLSLKKALFILLLALTFIPSPSSADIDCTNLKNSAREAREQIKSNTNKSNYEMFIATLGNPDGKEDWGDIYVWNKGNYRLRILLKNANSKIGFAEFSASTASASYNPPAEFETIMQVEGNDQKLVKAKELLGEQNMTKIHLTAYLWNCKANNVLKVNGKSIPLDQSLDVVFDQNNKFFTMFEPL